MSGTYCKRETSGVVISKPIAMKNVEREKLGAEELMQEAVSDELFLADLNETMEDFGYADQDENEILTMDHLAG